MKKDFVDMALEKAQLVESNPSNDEAFELCQLIIGLVDVINMLECQSESLALMPRLEVIR
jgi:hypothetical protein